MIGFVFTYSPKTAYKCPLESCGKSFAVRSNAKRHLRTHGITPTADSVQKAVVYSVNFHTPLVSIVHDTGDPQAKLRWIPQSITSLSNITWSRPTFLDSEDGFPVLPVPLLPSVSPTSSEFAAAGDTPYHPRDVSNYSGGRCLTLNWSVSGVGCLDQHLRYDFICSLGYLRAMLIQIESL